jgi:acyl carrier protein
VNREAVLDQIRQALEGELGVPADRITPAANLRDDLEMDSLDLVELVSILEDHLGSPIDRDEVEEVRTVDDVIDVLLHVVGDTQSTVAP